jgi:hypothetical protein
MCLKLLDEFDTHSVDKGEYQIYEKEDIVLVKPKTMHVQGYKIPAVLSEHFGDIIIKICPEGKSYLIGKNIEIITE